MPKPHSRRTRRLPVGADPVPGGPGTHFRVWAPRRKSLSVVFDGDLAPLLLDREPHGYFSALAPNVGAGVRYKYLLDNDKDPYPDPASRFQPFGPHGYSEVVDPCAFHWHDQNWHGIQLPGQVIYELHLGTFTHEGTWKSAAEKLPYLRDTGITTIELMPVAEFPGKFGWGYDGVQPYAPAAIYGQPNDMRSFVDQAHSFGIGVILDVVYNHLGPDGNYLTKYSPFYFTDKYETDWGAAINFDAEGSGPVREFFRENAAYWIREFHLDGLRLDATQDIHDDSQPNIIAQISEAARRAAGSRSIIVVGENEPQDTTLLQPVEEGGCGLDALWNDDYHHTAMVALTGKADAYYTDYRGSPQEFVSCMKYGYLYQGQCYRWQQQPRGTSTFGLPRPAMITFIQNHDQIANSARGQRITELSSPGLFRAVTTVTLLGPGTPMLFQGQEFGSSNPFLFFADQNPELGMKIREGRVEFLEQWRSLRLPEMRQHFADPTIPATVERCKLNFAEVETHSQMYRLHCDLLRLRREDPVFSRQGADGLDGAVLSPSAFVLRYFSVGHGTDRLIVVNFGVDLELDPAPEPLLAPPASAQWQKLWSSDDPAYGGNGAAPLDTCESWRIPGHAAVVLHPVAELQPRPKRRKKSQ
ncbi:MAG: malto-oligosyltrehalose trehalohydrolase [Acidobacteriaceae bacterium]|nr:malto-oligosyltrehalose trehalohydrolase [Acidobacteriaceae bacterium]